MSDKKIQEVAKEVLLDKVRVSGKKDSLGEVEEPTPRAAYNFKQIHDIEVFDEEK